ncbi:MAG: histidine kinase [Gemmatimonadaceae bacterium]|nr:histidine kinase [Gemmatimonadaceae bacterium]
MTTPTPQLIREWKPRRLVLFALAMMVAGFLAVFIADGATPGVGVVRDAIANTLAAAATALPVWWLCTRMHWRLADRWWFLPAHVLGAFSFTVLWYASIAIALAIVSLLSGDGFRLQFLSGPALHWEVTTAVVLYCAIAAGCYLFQAARDAQSAQQLQHASEMRAMRTQLDPHLLFNTLHSLLELVRSGDERADEAIDAFARVARYVSEGRAPDRDLVPLRDEWRMTQDYAALESLRLGPRLSCRFSLGEALDGIQIPALSLQPLVENAIRHGIGPRAGTGSVDVSVVVVERRVLLTVQDDGLGAAAATRGAGTGLDLVCRRLQAHFGESVTFSAGPRVGASGWRVVTTFPATVAS